VKTKLWVSVLCAAVAASPVAGAPAKVAPEVSYLEDSNVNDGKWIARIDGDAKTARQGQVVIDNFGGQWRETGPRRAGDPCSIAKPFPITVQRSHNKGLEFTVWAGEVSKCPTFELKLTVVD
jgi:hypothetical protein